MQNTADSGVTILTNNFIDSYMPRANGEFVKVYVYLLRMLSAPGGSFSLEQMADRLLCTERDILRALKYWEEKSLLTLSYSGDETLTGITLCSPRTQAENADTGKAPQLLSRQEAPVQAAAYADRPQTPEKPAPSLTPDRVKELKQNEEIVQLLYIAEQYLGKTLTPTEMKKLLYFYDELKFSPELIEYLIEHCVGRGHKSFRYIETVAFAWAKEGITTVAMAKDATSRYSREYFTILKAMGISGRNPVETELSLMNTWLKEYGFTMDIIQEACSRTVLQTGQPSFQYADKILSGWKNKGVKHLDDIRGLDAEHQKKKLEKAAKRQPAQPKSTNRFNNFHQREYDFDEYEKKLLNH